MHLLLHKSDLVPSDRLDEVVNCCKSRILKFGLEGIYEFDILDGATECSQIYNDNSHCTIPKVRFHKTSIWDESLFTAWSLIVCSFLKNLCKTFSYYDNFMQDESNHLKQICIFDKSMLLIYSVPNGLSSIHTGHFSTLLKHYKQQSKRKYKKIKWKDSNFIYSFICVNDNYLRLTVVTNNIEGENVLLKIQ